MAADGVVPSNKDRGYVLRRLLRRAILFARQSGMPDDWIEAAVDCQQRVLGDVYPRAA